MTQAAKKEKQDNVESLYSIARKYLEKYKGDTELAREALAADLRKYPEFLDSVLEQIIDEVARIYVTHQHRQLRKQNAINAFVPRSLDKKSVSKDLTPYFKSCLLDHPLMGGLKLRDASREKVIENALMYGTTEKDAKHKRIWLERIAKLLEPEQIVGKVLNEAKVKRLYEESKNA